MSKGYNVFFIDDDCYQIYDPMLFHSKPTSDIVTSQEQRDCDILNTIKYFYSSVVDEALSKPVMPGITNGLTLFRPSKS